MHHGQYLRSKYLVPIVRTTSTESRARRIGMDGTLTLINLAGSIALLLWGVHMVQSGIQRAFGPNLRRMLGAALSSRLKALFAGIGVTAVLQSWTSTAA